jgi:hypothetical protein
MKTQQRDDSILLTIKRYLMHEELKARLKEVGFNRSCLHYINTRRKLEGTTIKQIKAITDEELLESWLSMTSIAQFIKGQILLK